MSVKDNPEYRVWQSMKTRCHNPNDKTYKAYGARGITVCLEWRESFVKFLKDVGKRPTSEHQLDRIDNNQGYRPGNTRWATRLEQAANRRDNTILEFNGKSMILSEWARSLDITPSTLLERIERWGLEKALSVKKLPASPQARMVSAFGKTLPVKQWAKETGLTPKTIYNRLSWGWQAERALTEPPHRRMASACQLG